MVRSFSPVRPQSSPKGLAVASRIQDAWKGVGAAGGGAGIPEDGLLARYTANSVSISDGSVVDTWEDQHGDFHLTRAHSTTSPTVETDADGKKVLDFKGTNTGVMRLGSLMKLPPLTWIVAVSVVVTSNNQYIIHPPESWTGVPYFGLSFSRNIALGNVNTSFSPPAGKAIIGARTTDGEGASVFYNDTKQDLSPYPVSTSAFGGFTIGGQVSNGGNPWRGLIRQVLVYERALLDEEVWAAMDILKADYIVE